MSVEFDLLTYAEEDITVSTTAIGLTLTNVIATPPPRLVELFVEDAQIRYTLDGNDPTSSAAEILNPFDRLPLTHPGDMKRFRAIRTGSSDANIRARYKR